MIQILRKEGWMLNPNDKIVNAILKRCELNNGECPCHNTGEDKKCPCSDYRLCEKNSRKCLIFPIFFLLFIYNIFLVMMREGVSVSM